MVAPRWLSARKAYERDVRELAREAELRLAAGDDVERVARHLIASRNALSNATVSPTIPPSSP